MSRVSRTCVDCSRRKIRCNKVIPCDNCQKRGYAHLCRRAEVSQSGEGQQTSDSMSPGRHDFTPGQVPRGPPPIESPVNERILSMVTTLSDRVKELETKIHPDGALNNSHDISEQIQNVPFQLQLPRPSKRARVSSLSNQGPSGDSSPVQTGSDAEAEDAATVLEFLAWGRVKDSSLTNGVKEVSNMIDPNLDIIQATQALGYSPNSISVSQVPVENLTMSQIQEMLPTKEQVYSLFEYHSNWLLFMHCSFHTPTLRREIDQFYNHDHGNICPTSPSLQWTALLFAVICGSMTCVKPEHIAQWGFREEDQCMLAQRWYKASNECLSLGRYQEIHNTYSVQTIGTSTICAHILGFSNSHSILLTCAVRIAQALGLHRLGKSKIPSPALDAAETADLIQKEQNRKLWQELATQDWFSTPFSETYCINALHFTTRSPQNCDEETLQSLPPFMPSITSYGNFLYKVASLMPALVDQLAMAVSQHAKYEQVLGFDKIMREIVLSQLPSCLNSQTPIDPNWPLYVTVARRCLTITCAHKIIMIHRRFLGMSFHDQRYSRTRKTCLAAAKTILNEMKQDFPEEAPLLWTVQAFSVAAAIILSLDIFNRPRAGTEYEEHRQLISATITTLSKTVAISSIAARGTRLLTGLLAEEDSNSRNHDGDRNFDKQRGNSDRISAFVRKFCESDQSQPRNSPIVTSHMPLWLQQEDSFDYLDSQSRNEQSLPPSKGSVSYGNGHTRSQQPTPTYDMPEPDYQYPTSARRQGGRSQFNQHLSESFDVRSLNWFDDLLGLAPSNSI